jgi:parvulin-like peptidyl-prolyl isomerase
MKNKLCFCALAVLLSTALWAAEPKPKDPDTVLAKIGAERLTYVEYQNALAEVEQNKNRKLDIAERKDLLQSLINQRMLVAEAEKLGLEKDKTVKQILAEARRRALANSLYEREVLAGSGPSATEVDAAYARDSKAYSQRRVSQILIKGQNEKSQKKAKEIFAQARKNPKGFAALAQKQSQDELNRLRGGDFGWVNRGALLPELEKVIFEAPLGKVLEPVLTQHGWHILLVKEERIPSLADAQPTIAEALAKQKQAEKHKALLQALPNKHKVVLDEKALEGLFDR